VTPQQILERLKSLPGAMTASQLATLAVAFVAVVGLVAGSAWWLSRPTYALLFADMDPAAASEVVAKLDAQKVDYRLDSGGRNIRVPDSLVDKLRIEFSAGGLPSSGRIGFEIFDRTNFGATEFLEHVNYRRALEGEIARTITTLGEVASARVHIAMAKESLFGAKEQPAKASVVLKLRSNRPLAAGTITGITNLVAASVEGLRPESVVVLDSFGRPLARPPAADDGQPLGGAEMERQQRIERELGARVVSLLEPVVGENRVRANVAVRLSSDSEERTEEVWDPATPVVRSKQQSTDLTPLPGGGGIAGARANLPSSAPPATATAQGGPAAAAAPVPPNMASRSTETTNYEISRTTKHVVRPRGDVARVTVAVVVDDELETTKDKEGKIQQKSKPRTPAELQKLQGLVAAAVGIDQTRGDLLTVENIAFDAPLVEEPAPPSLVDRYGGTALDVGRMVTVLGVAVLLILFVLRPMVGGGAPRKTVKKGAAVSGAAGELLAGQASPPAARTVRELEGEIEAQLDAAAQAKTLENLRVPVLTKKANAMINNEPENAARLLRGWLSEEQ
jgi:flagellar M-ring protein FliF